MQKLEPNHIRDFYNNVKNVWNENDPWHEYSQKIISSYIKDKLSFENTIVLNAGSAGNNYGIECQIMYHVDIADKKIKNIPNAFVASIENLPFQDNFFDNIVCVGSVLNYCDAMAALSELSRVLKPSGTLVLEYESSWGFEYIGKACYKKESCIITTEYIEKSHNQWLYSPDYILAILSTYDFIVTDQYPFHISDGLFCKFLNDKLAVQFTDIDKILRYLPFFKKHGNNIILCCNKKN